MSCEQLDGVLAKELFTVNPNYVVTTQLVVVDCGSPVHSIYALTDCILCSSSCFGAVPQSLHMSCL